MQYIQSHNTVQYQALYWNIYLSGTNHVFKCVLEYSTQEIKLLYF